MSDGYIGHSVVEEYGPDIAEPLVCFRAFIQQNIRYSPPLLSPTKGYIWYKDNTARCAAYTHNAPAESCMCGLYGYHSVNHARRYNNFNRRCPIVGIIQCWGRTYIHGKGLRTEHARIVAIAPNNGKPLSVLTLSWALENNITVFNSPDELAEVVEDYGTPSITLISKRRRLLGRYGLGPLLIALNLTNIAFVLLHVYN